MNKNWIPLRLRDMTTGIAIENIHKLPLPIFLKECEKILGFDLEEVTGVNGEQHEYFHPKSFTPIDFLV